MSPIQRKTLEDLEFPEVLKQLASRCNTLPGKQRALETGPIEDSELLKGELGRTSEYLSSFENDNRIPNHGFEPLDKEFQLLQIENSVMEVRSFQQIAQVCETVFAHHKFFEKFKEYYPLLKERVDSVPVLKSIPEEISACIDRFGEVRDQASPALRDIRSRIAEVRTRVNKSFGDALARYLSMDYLDEIKETVVDNRRVLAVKAMYRRKVKGIVLGSSKTGSIVYMSPAVTDALNQELSNLEYEEREEIRRILKELTNLIRPYREVLMEYQELLTGIDLIAGKARLASETKSILPEINTQRNLFLKDAFHPLLFLGNLRTGDPTYPQTIRLDDENRIIVISGPNAGGKSITLKTVGLLQLMLQSGFLVPVHERSSMCLFDRILTDIGDNQSIENHLSTYSYRLKNMNRFLKRCNSETLFLIDEFGTGSDPELGGALAEAFLEVFYERKAFGIITTHYANLKLLANELPHATNANMQFDGRTLEPTFRLVLGEAGSSFTFEVAQKNGIPYSLINRAKKKIESGKVRFDATIAKLQKQRSQMERSGSKLEEELQKATDEGKRFESLNTRLKDKLERYQEMYDTHQRMISLGSKVNEAAARYFQDGKKRNLISELLRIVETENSKRKKKSAQEFRQEKEEQESTRKEIMKDVVVVREKKKKEKKEKSVTPPKPKPALKVGDRVRMADGRAVGDIESIEKNKATVNYGMFTTLVSLDQLELVQAAGKNENKGR